MSRIDASRRRLHHEQILAAIIDQPRPAARQGGLEGEHAGERTLARSQSRHVEGDDDDRAGGVRGLVEVRRSEAKPI